MRRVYQERVISALWEQENEMERMNGWGRGLLRGEGSSTEQNLRPIHTRRKCSLLLVVRDAETKS